MSIYSDFAAPSPGGSVPRLAALLTFLGERLAASDMDRARLMLHAVISPAAARDLDRALAEQAAADAAVAAERAQRKALEEAATEDEALREQLRRGSDYRIKNRLKVDNH
jgi:hypothetical protein